MAIQVAMAVALASWSAPAMAQPSPEPATTQIIVTTDPPGAVVTVDGRAVGDSPIAVPDLAPGSHVVSAFLPDGRQANQSITVEEGRTMVVRLPLGGAGSTSTSVVTASASDPPAPATEPRPEPVSTVHEAAEPAPLEASLGVLGDTSWRGSGTGGLRPAGIVLTSIGSVALIVGLYLINDLLSGDSSQVEQTEGILKLIFGPITLATGLPMFIGGLVVLASPSPPEPTEAGVRFGRLQEPAVFARGLSLRAIW